MSLGIYRVTESDDQRTLEDGSGLRVTENYISGESSLSASGSVVVAGRLILPVSVSVSGGTTLTATATVNRYAVLLVANNSVLQASVKRTTVGASSLQASSSVVAVATLKSAAVTSLVASGTIGINSRVLKLVSVVSGDVEFERITENEDSRITEDGDQRITHLIRTNQIDSSLIANAELTPFSSVAYIKQDGAWKQVLSVDVKGGSWNATEKIYKNLSGKWKRIY